MFLYFLASLYSLITHLKIVHYIMSKKSAIKMLPNQFQLKKNSFYIQLEKRHLNLLIV